MRLWPLKMPTQNVLMLLVLLMLMLWNVRACRQQFGWEFWSWCLVETLNLNICQDIESKVLSTFWNKFSSKLWSWSLLNLFVVKFGCFTKAFTSAQLNPRVRCVFGNVFQATLFQKTGFDFKIAAAIHNKVWSERDKYIRRGLDSCVCLVSTVNICTISVNASALSIRVYF